MSKDLSAWLNRRPRRWAHLDEVPLSQLCVLLLAVFSLFSVIGFYLDIVSGGRQPLAVVMFNAAFNGLNAMLWIIVLARFTMIWILGLAVLQFFSAIINVRLGGWISAKFHLSPTEGTAGTSFAATAILIVVLFSYICYASFIRMTGRESFRLRTELALAHSIQKTLVPLVSKKTRCFEIFGISEPSEKVGGDLVDAVEIRGGDLVAYIADIAGHGLQAGILMGMLKTAARTALSGDEDREQGEALSYLMKRLNEVLPQVKEANMYATFTALRLNLDGRAYYGMAASPPLLHWHAKTQSVKRVQEDQFPLGLLPVPDFPAYELAMGKDDLVLIATDGIYEVTSRADSEFGIDTLEALLATHSEMPLADIVASILRSVRNYGKQVDDQTLLLVRKLVD
jgi:hypothetical protein